MSAEDRAAKAAGLRMAADIVRKRARSADSEIKDALASDAWITADRLRSRAMEAHMIATLLDNEADRIERGES